MPAAAFVASGLVATAAAVAGQGAPAGDARTADASLAADARLFWLGATPEARAGARDRLLASGAPVDSLVAALEADPSFPGDVERGRLDRSIRTTDGRVHPYTLLIPEGYTPDRGWPVLVYLHGGIGRAEWTRPGEWWRDYERIADPERIVIVPASWRESMWWQESQIESLAAILARTGREYRIDRDRVHLIGISDGATGVYYHAARAATPWASFLAFIGHPAVLSNPRLGVEGQMYVTNLRNRPLFVVNGGRDRLYPTSSVEPFIRLFSENGVPLIYRPKPEAGHDLTWVGEEGARIDSFVVATPRDPLPDRLEWETEVSGGRFGWLVIDEVGHVEGESDLPGRNELTVDGESERYLAFPHRLASGRAVIEREGNVVRVRTDGVAAFRLLVSPREFDLSRPITVEVNGRVRHDERVEPSARTLLDRATADRDPRMLFVTDVVIDLRDPPDAP
ncbi:MAG: hypothetical protein R3195_14265 [Gemmatimonadota bacterium]|nr:hypothetical protein [Gemmatimonadota bacterium]